MWSASLAVENRAFLFSLTHSVQKNKGSGKRKGKSNCGLLAWWMDTGKPDRHGAGRNLVSLASYEVFWAKSRLNTCIGWVIFHQEKTSTGTYENIIFCIFWSILSFECWILYLSNFALYNGHLCFCLSGRQWPKSWSLSVKDMSEYTDLSTNQLLKQYHIRESREPQITHTCSQQPLWDTCYRNRSGVSYFSSSRNCHPQS